jgi:hypothetical protein
MDKNFTDSNRYNINPSTVYCRSKVLPIIKKETVYRRFSRPHTSQIPFYNTSRQSNAETLLKTNQIEVLQNAYYSSDKIENIGTV